MSGGSMNYLCFSLAEAVGKMQDPELDELVKDLSDVLYELEWWDSGDTGEERYREKANEFKRKWFKAERNERLARYIEIEMQKMTKAVKEILEVKKMSKKGKVEIKDHILCEIWRNKI